jgi:hypothetical protein
MEFPERIPAEVFKNAIIELAGINAAPQYAIKFYDKV